MTITVEAVYKDGVLKPKKKLRIPDGTRVRVIVAPMDGREGAPAAQISPGRQKQAWERLRKLQRKTAKALDRHGITEEDIVREILKDD